MFGRVRAAWISWRWLPDRIGQLTALQLTTKAILETNMDELKAMFREATSVLEEVRFDLQSLSDRMKEGGLTAEEVREVKAELAAHIERLRTAAAIHEPAPEPTPVDPAAPAEG